MRSRLALLSITLLALSSCASEGIKFVHPQSGATAECSASGFGIGAAFVEGTIADCATRYEAKGYWPLEKLTAEQRLDLDKRGLLQKD
jgi:hypothetical protein